MEREGVAPRRSIRLNAEDKAQERMGSVVRPTMDEEAKMMVAEEAAVVDKVDQCAVKKEARPGH